MRHVFGGSEEEILKARKTHAKRPLGPRDPIWRFIGRASSGVEDGAVEHDRYIAKGRDNMRNGPALAFDRKAEAIYRKKLKPKLEGKYKGRIVAIDVGSGDYFLGKTVLEAIEKGRKKHPGKIFYAVRIGYPAVHSLRRSWPSEEK